jgi:peptidyl-prolyl cis-trans isomerase SurA
LAVGELTPPAIITTREGKQAYRMLYLKSRTKPHVENLTDDYQRIQSAALLEKQQKVIDEWINKKIVTTYVKIVAEDKKGCKFEHNWVTAP